MVNIFITDKCPEVSAYNLCYRHVVKMILECAQLLSTTHRYFDDNNANEMGLYKASHINHPSAKWCRESADNYLWVYNHMVALGDIYLMQTGKQHKSIKQIGEQLGNSPAGIIRYGLTPFVAVVPDYINSKQINVFDKYKLTLIEKYKEWATREKPLSVEFPIATPEWFV